jgi:hypothetical protein
MPARNDTLKNRLSRRREIRITVTGRVSGWTIAIPVWFVLEDGKLYLLPARGSDTQWYRNVRKYPSIRIAAGGAEDEREIVPVTEPAEVTSVIEKFRGKYGDDGLKLYAKLDVAVIAELR